MHILPPLTLKRRLDSRIWGGERLAAWMRMPEAPSPLAEVWLVYEENIIADGPLAGMTLGAAAQTYGAALLGSTPWSRYGAEFPLLAKFLDAADHLSLQVHPDDAYAHSVEAASGFHGKTEAWHILEAKADAEVLHGFAAPTDRATVAAAIDAGTVLDLIRHVPVQAGDTVYVPAGTVHAINAGVMLFEIQQKSDLTYRLYDYGRPRELQLERGLDVASYGVAPAAHTKPQPLGPGRELLVRSPYFALERWQLAGSMEYTLPQTSFAIATLIAGTLALTSHAGTQRLQRGDALVLPASLGSMVLEAEAATLLWVTVPEEDA